MNLQEGWGKSWSYVIGFSRLGVADVSLRYSKDHSATRIRQAKIADPEYVALSCKQLTQHLRGGVPEVSIQKWQLRDLQEAEELKEGSRKPEVPLQGKGLQNL